MKKLGWLLLIGVLSYFVWSYGCQRLDLEPELVERVERNYGKAIEEVCQEEGVSANYFKALAILEVSARATPPSRTEGIIWKRFQEVRSGAREKYSFFTTEDLKSRSDTDLKFMATSWGPFQIMGFHAIREGFPLKNLRNEHAVRTGIRWCIGNYGEYLRREDFRNAFHIHNTGKPLPKIGRPLTTDPDYVQKGVAYMKMLRFAPPLSLPKPQNHAGN